MEMFLEYTCLTLINVNKYCKEKHLLDLHAHTEMPLFYVTILYNGIELSLCRKIMHRHQKLTIFYSLE